MRRRARIGGSGRRTCATANPKRSTTRSSATATPSSSPSFASGSPTASWSGPPSGAQEPRPRDRLLSRSCCRGRAGRRRILGARQRARARRHRRRAARSVLRARPELEPAGAQPAGRRARGLGLAERVYRANMRHAGMLRIDHAMGLKRLFLIPEGARPAEGAYLSYPLDDLLGHVALESQRAECMVVGEDLGTVPEGFRDRMARANIQACGCCGSSATAPNAAAGTLSADVGRLRRHARSGDPRRLVARRRHWRAADARPPDGGRGRARQSPRGARRNCGLSLRFSPPVSLARRRSMKRRSPTRSPRRSTRSSGARARSSLTPSSTTSSARQSRPTCRGRIASARTGASKRPRMSPPPSRTLARGRSSRRWPGAGRSQGLLFAGEFPRPRARGFERRQLPRAPARHDIVGRATDFGFVPPKHMLHKLLVLFVRRAGRCPLRLPDLALAAPRLLTGLALRSKRRPIRRSRNPSNAFCALSTLKP